MTRIIKSALYKLLKDWTFRITLIIGVALAVFLNLIYLGVDLIEDASHIGESCNGQTMFLNSLTPTQNFGLTVPINLIVYTIGEFTCGTIRNKIIAGHRKTFIYLSLIITGIIFTISLMAIYFGLSVGIATIIGGFKPKSEYSVIYSSKFLFQYVIMALCVYIFIVTFAIFVATSIRSIGGALPIVIVAIVALYFIPMISSVTKGISIALEDISYVKYGLQGWLNPFTTFGYVATIDPVYIKNWFAPAIITPLYWSGIFIGLGLFAFNARDVK